jgi:hypothetical protein
MEAARPALCRNQGGCGKELGEPARHRFLEHAAARACGRARVQSLQAWSGRIGNPRRRSLHSLALGWLVNGLRPAAIRDRSRVSPDEEFRGERVWSQIRWPGREDGGGTPALCRNQEGCGKGLGEPPLHRFLEHAGARAAGRARARWSAGGGWWPRLREARWESGDPGRAGPERCVKETGSALFCRKGKLDG